MSLKYLYLCTGKTRIVVLFGTGHYVCTYKKCVYNFKSPININKNEIGKI